MNKRGDVSQVEDIAGFLWKVLIIIVVFVMVFMLIRSHAKLEVDTFDAEANLFAFRLLYAKGALSYYDTEIDRVYPGVIDLARFEKDEYQDSLENAIHYEDDSHVAAAIEIITEDGVKYGPVYVNQDYYNRWKPIARTFGTGPGAVRMLEKSFYVLLKDRQQVNEELLDLYDSWDPRRDALYLDINDGLDFEDLQYVPARMSIIVLIPNS